MRLASFKGGSTRYSFSDIAHVPPSLFFDAPVPLPNCAPCHARASEMPAAPSRDPILCDSLGQSCSHFVRRGERSLQTSTPLVCESLGRLVSVTLHGRLPLVLHAVTIRSPLDFCGSVTRTESYSQESTILFYFEKKVLFLSS